MLKQRLNGVQWLRRVNETTLTAHLKNGSEIALRGADNPDSLRGVGLDFVVMDEFADVKESAWGEVLRPTLSDTEGSALFIGTPRGRNWAYRLWSQGREGVPGWAAWRETTLDGGTGPRGEIDAAAADLDELTFRQEYLASFVNFEGRAYYPFESNKHCASLSYDPTQPLVLCFDFNIAPGVAVICQEDAIGTAVIGEVWIPRNSNTPAVCRKIRADWGHHQGPVTIYGDATGGARGTAKVAGSDWELVEADFRGLWQGGHTMRVPRSNPAERVRLNAVNSRLLASTGDVRLRVDPARAPHVVADLEGVQLLAGGSGEIDKRADPQLTHISDALGYYIAYEFPQRTRAATVVPVSGF